MIRSEQMLEVSSVGDGYSSHIPRAEAEVSGCGHDRLLRLIPGVSTSDCLTANTPDCQATGRMI